MAALKFDTKKQSLAHTIHIDVPLLLLLLTLMLFGLTVIYSAGGGELALIKRQVTRLAFAMVILFIMAQIPIHLYKRLSIYFYLVTLLLLIGVIFFGVKGGGAQRWLDLGVARFQPSEIMKLAMPMAVAWYISRFPLPPRSKHIVFGFIFVAIPPYLIFKQPDLGTATLVASSGVFALFLAGMSWRFVSVISVIALIAAPILFNFVMHGYMRQRVLTFLDPEKDPLGAGYHIIQSKIAIGSGGFSGKGWMQGTQSQLEFLPERHTDFIFAVFSEEYGFTGVFLLLCLYTAIIVRGMTISMRAQDPFSRVLGGSIILTFFVYVFVNIGMVSGMLPVVGVPLPLISYGGTSMVTLLAGFGVLMAIGTQQRIVARNV